MKRRILSLILTLAMVLPMLPGTARAAEGGGTAEDTNGNIVVVDEDGEELRSYTDLQEAVDAAGEGETVKLKGDVELPKRVNINKGKSTTVDLGNYTLSCVQPGGTPQIFYVTNGTLTLKGTTGTITGSNLMVYVNSDTNNAKLVLDGANITQDSQNTDFSAVYINGGKSEGIIRSGTITGAAHSDSKTNVAAVNVNNGSKLTVSGKAKITTKTGGTATGISVFNASTLIVEDGAVIESKSGFAIATNGKDLSENKIEIRGGTVTGSKDAAGIYLPSGTLTIGEENKDGSPTISGGAGIVVRGGTLTVHGGTIEASGEDDVYIGDAKPCNVPPAGIAFDKNDSYAKGKVEIKGGVVRAAAGKPAVAYTEEGKVPGEPPESYPIEITGGKFFSGSEPDKDVEGFVDKNEKRVNRRGEVTDKGIYVVDVLKMEYGTVEAELADTVEGTEVKEGTKIKLTVKPEEGYMLKEGSLTVKPDDETVLEEGKTGLELTLQTDGTYTFTMPASDVTVSAEFEEVPSTVPVTGVTLNKTTLTLKVGESEQLTATVLPETATNNEVTWDSSDTTVATVSDDGTVKAVKEGGPVTITVTTTDGEKTATCTVTVTAAETPPTAATYEIKTSVSPEGSGTVTAKPEKAKEGETVTLTVSPNTGYELDKLTVADAAGKPVDVAKDNTFKMPAGDVTVTATFKKQSASDPGTDTPGTDSPGTDTPGGSTPNAPTYLITLRSTAGGTATGGGAYEKGKTVTVQATPANGYRFAYWLENGVIASTNAAYSFIATANRTLTAVFGAINSSGSSSGSSSSSDNISYRVVVPVVPNGSATVSSHSVKAGDTVTVIAMPDSGYATAGISVTNRSGGSISVRDTGDNVYTFTMPASQATVNLSFTAARTSAPSTSVPSKMPGSPSVSTVNSFTDVPADYAAAVAWAVGRGITAGTGNGAFSPNDTCTRGQILTFIWRAQGMPEPVGANPFTDIKPSDYYYKAAMWAYEKGMVNGRTFDADAPCTRSEAVTYLWQLAWQAGIAPASSSVPTAFSDVPAFGYASRAIPWAVSKGITNGTSVTTFSPEAVCTRGQIVTFLYRFDMLS